MGIKRRRWQKGKLLAGELIASGKAFERFRQMVEMQGGDVGTIDDPTRLPSADLRIDVPSATGGYVTEIFCEQVGTACVVLGGGRERKEDSVDPAVGIVIHKKIGDKVSAGEPLCTIHCHSEAQAARAKKMLEESYKISAVPPAHKPSLIHRVIYKGETGSRSSAN